MSISVPIGHLYLRKRKHSPCNTINPMDIPISTAWVQHSGRHSLAVGSAGSRGCPCSATDLTPDRTAQGKPGGMAVLPRAALVRRSTCGSPSRRIWTQHPLKPSYCSKPSCPFHPAWVCEVLCSRSSKSQGSLSVTAVWALAVLHVWGKDDFLGSQGRGYSFWMKYFLPRVLFKYFQTFFWNK